ncbi:hypothetical protein CK203_060129 [Vitis vinifera]|uniref:Integrase catalytic domain-containing protein n=1 Tax=Vitis vinifera TaxID=29760 RepID=A0A438GGJ0_VITVI|nr:hypothetical protein CK203_060129 [Vitis vinifera]
MGLNARLPVPSWEMSLDVRAKTWVTWFLEWRAPHEASFTSPPALVGGRITGRCSAGGDNFKLWKERILIQLGCMDIDYAIRKDELPKITDTNTLDRILFLGEHPNYEVHILKLTDIKGVHEHIMEMRDIVAQLKKLEVEMFESFLVHFILNTLLLRRLMMEQGENVTLLTQKKGKSQANRKGKHQIPPKADIKKDEKCFFCKKKEHVKKKCLKFQIWLEKKDNPTSFVCYESNMVNVNTNSWWIDSGSTIHISNSLQGHISIDRIKRLVNDDEVLSTLDFTDFETCVDCIKEKQTNKLKKGATRSFAILEIIRIDICSLDMNSHDRDGEYYGRYMEIGQAPRPFSKFLQEHGIVAQYTMPGSPYQNCVAERRNRTLLDMVRSMLSNSKLPRFLWTEALKTTVSKGYGFYYPTHNTRIVESRNAKFLEYDLVSGSNQFGNIVSDIDHTESQPSTSSDKLFVIHNTPQVQMGVEQTIVEVQPIIEDQPVIEVPQVIDNISVDQVDQELHDTSEKIRL